MTDTLRLRIPTMADAQAVTDLFIAKDIADYGAADFDLETLVIDWQDPDFDLSRNAWMVLTDAGQLVGFGDLHVNGGDLDFDYVVHPDFDDTRVGSILLHAAERRAYELLPELADSERIAMFAGFNHFDAGGQGLVNENGFTSVRHFYRMEIQMEAAPPAAVWPDGITVRTFVPGQDDEATHAADQESFADHWGFVPTPYEEWSRELVQRSDFDASLWFLAMSGDEIAGVALCNYRAGVAWVKHLGVRRPWRKHGLGMALLLHAFGEFQRRGEKVVGLGVDASSPTGATRLYERAGMQITRHYIVYQKVLREAIPAV